MATFKTIQTSFTSGELSPQIALGRVDVSKYNNGLRRLENVVLPIQGGAKRRPGTRFLREVKDSTKLTRLIDFVFNRSQAYVLEMGEGYMRVIRDGTHVMAGPSPFELVTPWLASQLLEMSYVQKKDTCFFAHRALYPQRLQRFADDSWAILNTPFLTAPFEEQGEVPAAGLTLSAASVGTGRTATASGSAFLASDVGRDLISGAGLATITGFTSATVVTIEIKTVFASTSIASGAWKIDGSPQTTLTPSAKDPLEGAVTLTLTDDGWRSSDVGKYVEVNDGLVLITGYTSAKIVTGVIKVVLSATVAAPKNAWVLNSDAWNAQNGYPQAVTINKQRLLYAGSPAYPQTIWSSAIQEYLSFRFGVDDDDAFRFELDGPRNSPIKHLTPSRQLIALTDSDEMSLKGGVEKPITPTNITKDDESSAGANYVRPVKVGNELLFIQAAGKSVQALGYRYEVDGFLSPDRTIFSDHITGDGITGMWYQKKPYSTVFCVRTDGQMAVAAYDLDQEVNGWGRWITQGYFESGTSIPTATSDESYVTVRRIVEGADRRYIEVFDPDMYVDCGVKYSNPAGQTVFTGLDHLEGLTVQVRADGAFLGEYVVEAGQVTLPRPGKEVQIGLGFSSLVEPLQPEIGGNGTTAQGTQVNVNEVVIRVLDTAAAVINGVDVEFRTFDSELLDKPPPVVSGDFRKTTLQDEIYRTNLVITQPYPMPFHLLDIVRQVTINS